MMRFSKADILKYLCGFAAACLIAPAFLHGQTQPRRTIGAQLQAYPAGVIPAVSISKSIGHRQFFTLLAGYNFTERRDFGKHDNEEGGGPGFGTAWRYYFRNRQGGWYLGARTDVWFLQIDWRDDVGNRSGTTDITVLQPTAQGGYRWLFGDNLTFAATAALGAEINIRTDGEAVGEGAILLIGLELGYRF